MEHQKIIRKKKLSHTVIRISPKVEGAAVIVDAIIGTHREASHALSLIVVHVDSADVVGKRDQPGVSVE